MNDAQSRQRLSEEIATGATLMRVDALGRPVFFFYPNRDAGESYVLSLGENVQGGVPVYVMGENAQPNRNALSHYSGYIGTREIKIGGEVLQRFALSQLFRVSANGSREAIGYVGYDAWGKVIINAHVVDGAVTSVRANLGESASILGDEALRNLGLVGSERIERLFNDFDRDAGSAYTFNLIAQSGWVINRGERTLALPDGSLRSFGLMQQIGMDNKVERTFGIDRDLNEIRMTFIVGI